MTHIIHRNPRKSLATAVGGQGCFLFDQQGKRYYDGSGGAAVSCLGHGHPEVVEAVVAQVRKLEYAHSSFFTTEPAEQLADFLAQHSPAGLSNVYFLSGGSEAVETALKMARQYHVECGQPQRRYNIARQQSYHGNTLGALGIGGHRGRRALFQPLLVPTRHVSPCFAHHYKRDGESDDAYGARLARELEDTILELGADSVSAFIAETVVGATAGAVCAVPGYFRKIREVCDRYGVLLIIDEVMSGIGRTGYFHAFEAEQIVPDLLCLAKGLGGGYQPIAAVIAQDRIAQAFAAGSGAFQHGHTYVGHPVACAASLAVQNVIERDGLVRRSAELGAYLQQQLRVRLGDHPNVGDVRGRGLFQAVEFVASREDGTAFEPRAQLHARIKDAALSRGLLCYSGGGTIDGERGDHILLAPPYITSASELDAALDILAQAVDAAIAEVRSLK